VGRLGEEFFNWDVIWSMFPGLLTEAVKNTMILTALSFTVGIALGLVLALLRISRWRLLRWPVAVYIDVMRGLPLLLVIVFIGFGLPIALQWRYPNELTPGVTALGLVYAAYIAESIRAGIQAVPKGQMEAALSTGMPYWQAMQHVILPQAFRIVIPPLTNELLALFKDTSLVAILGTVAGGKEITKYARDFANGTANSSPLVAAGMAYLVITLPMLRLVAWLDKRGRSGSHARA
jgi:polar amino acid transport system permease protein